MPFGLFGMGGGHRAGVGGVQRGIGGMNPAMQRMALLDQMRGPMEMAPGSLMGGPGAMPSPKPMDPSMPMPEDPNAMQTLQGGIGGGLSRKGRMGGMF